MLKRWEYDFGSSLSSNTFSHSAHEDLPNPHSSVPPSTKKQFFFCFLWYFTVLLLREEKCESVMLHYITISCNQENTSPCHCFLANSDNIPVYFSHVDLAP